MNPSEMSRFAPQQQSQPSYSRWHVLAGKEQRLCLSCAKMSQRSWSSILCTFCYKVSLQFALRGSSKFPVWYNSWRWTMYAHWIVTLLTCTDWQLSLTECSFIWIYQNYLILWTILSLSSAKAWWKPVRTYNTLSCIWGPLKNDKQDENIPKKWFPSPRFKSTNTHNKSFLFVDFVHYIYSWLSKSLL